MGKIDVFLSDLFDGIVLENMKVIVDSEKELENLKLFIILNEGKHMCSIDLANEYRLYVYNRKIINKKEFVNMYNNESSIIEKKEICERLFLAMINKILIYKIDKLLENGLTKEELYDSIIKYKKYNPLQAVKMIEIHNKRKHLTEEVEV